jgi:FkbM family methyltransferase
MGFHMELDLRNEQQRRIFLGCFDRWLEREIKRLLPSGGTFVDIGANIGFVSLLAARCTGSSGRVLAFEPGPAFPALERHLAQAPWGKAFRVALGASEGPLTLFVPPPEEHRDFNVSIVAQAGATPLQVRQRKLDDILDEQRVEAVDLLKLDVEGSEPAVLDGAARVLERTRHLICEINGPYLVEQGLSPQGLVRQITGKGFRLVDASGHAPRGFPETTNCNALFSR